MKKTLLILAALLSGFAFVSCEKPESEPAAQVSPVKSADLSIAAKGGSATITMEAGVIKKASTSSDWLKLSVAGDVITATAEVNSAILSRYAIVEVETADETLKFTVMQYGFRTSGFSAPDQLLTSAAKELTFSYEYDELMEVSNSASWITVDVTEKALKLSVAEDATEATATDRQRVAEVKWTLGADTGVITVTQHHKNFMVLDSNWAVSYLGVQKYQGDDVEEVQNTVTDPKISVPYAIYAMPKSDLGSLDLATYVETELPVIMKANYDEYIAYYASVGMTGLTYSDFLYEGTDFEIFDIFETGDYYGIAIGLDENCEPSGPYQFCEFTKTSGGNGGGGDDQPKGYAAWLGDWKVLHGTSTSQYDTWTISENVKDESYYISGIEGYTDLKIVANYENGSLVLFAQQEVGTKPVGGEDCSVGFYGATAAGNFWTPGANPYTIATGTINADGTATLTPGVVNSDSGQTTVELAVYIATASDGSYKLLKKFADATKVPATLSREGGNGGGGDNGGGNQGGTGSAAFNKFITTWQGTPADASAEAWVADFRQVEADKTVAIYGWQDWSDDWMSPISATFASADASLTFKGGTGEVAASNVDIGAPEGAMNIYYMGSAVIDGQSYVITSGTSMYDACKAVIDGSNLKITGLEVKLSDGNTYPFTEFGVVAMDAAQTAIYTFKNELGNFPYTLTKPGTSSVKVMGRTYNLSMENAVRIDRSQMLEAVVVYDCQKMTAIQAISAPVKIKKLIRK